MTVLASTGVGAVTNRHSLVWTEYGYLIAALVAAILVLDTEAADAVKIPVLVRHFSLFILAPTLLLALAGRKVQTPSWQRTSYTAQVMGAAWPIFMLSGLIVAGSLYARLFAHIQNTFLVVGLYMAVTLCAALMVLQSAAPEKLVRGYFRILLAAALIMSVVLIINFRVRQVYHEQIFLVIPMAALFVAQAERTLMRWLACAFFLVMAWVSQKYTSYLIGALVAGYLALAVVFPSLRVRFTLQRVTAIYWSGVLAILAAMVLVFLALSGLLTLPTGNPQYRLYTYAAAWSKFTDSPLWGTLFKEEAVEKFTQYSIGIAGNVLPTHSDILDLLANGGILAMTLWLFGLGRIGWIASRNLLRPRFLDHPWAPYAHTLALMSLAGVVTYAFNPILLQPPMAYLLWTNLGLLLGLSLRARDEYTASSR